MTLDLSYVQEGEGEMKSAKIVDGMSKKKHRPLCRRAQMLTLDGNVAIVLSCYRLFPVASGAFLV